MATEPEATAQWMEIFHTVVMTASTATLVSMKARYPVTMTGAPRTISRIRPTVTDAVMNASTISRGRRAPTFLSAQRPWRMPWEMNSVGRTAAKNTASSPQPAPARPSACAPIRGTVTISQFLGSSR